MHWLARSARTATAQWDIRHVSDSEKMTALVELAGAVAHELNNIFTAVAGNLSLLDEELPDRESSTRIGDVIRTAQRGIALSAKLQAFAGRQPLKRKRIDASGLVGKLVQELPRNLLTKTHLRISLAREESVAVCFSCCAINSALTASRSRLSRSGSEATSMSGVCHKLSSIKRGKVP